MVLAQVKGETFWEIVRSKGLRSLYNGAMATLYRDITFNCCLFAGRAFIMKRYEDRAGVEPGPYMKVWYGLPASVMAGIVACPFDVVKTRIQGVASGGMYVHYSGTPNTLAILSFIKPCWLSSLEVEKGP